jgi:formiminotetrahydrofolate cyclodeaminase
MVNEPDVTTQSIREFAAHVSQSNHAMAGAVIAASAAEATALGLACVRISLAHQPGSDSTPAEQLAAIQETLLGWGDQDATAIAQFVALHQAGRELAGQQLLCQAPAEICALALEAATLLQDFRPQVSEQVQDDLEMAITLLAGSAQAAMLLLDSNLRLWPEPELLAQFEPIRAGLAGQISQLTPVARIRK